MGVNGFSDGYPWIAKERSALVDKLLAHDLNYATHRVRFTVLNETEAEDGGRKFDIVGIATSPL